jgi:hypothetical protein
VRLSSVWDRVALPARDVPAASRLVADEADGRRLGDSLAARRDAVARLPGVGDRPLVDRWVVAVSVGDWDLPRAPVGGERELSRSLLPPLLG